MTVNFVVYSLMGPVVGWGLDKFGARLTASIGLFIGAIGFLVLSAARSLPVFYLSYQHSQFALMPVHSDSTVG